MRTYFVGGSAEIAKGRLDRFGQVVDVTEGEWLYLVKGRIALLPEDEFEKIGFTEQELSLHARPADLVRAPAAFHEKRDAAQARFIEIYRAVMTAPPVVEIQYPEVPINGEAQMNEDED